MAKVSNKSDRDTFALLKIALDRGFILPLSGLDENLRFQSYKFGHDRIQQAAYDLISNADKAATHYRIGTMLYQQLSSTAKSERIFELVGPLNYGISLITEIQKRDEFAKLNLITCRKARDATAYQTSREYAIAGLSWLGKKAWFRQYKITFALFELAVELASLCGDVEEMERLVETVATEAKSVLDRLPVYHTQIIPISLASNPQKPFPFPKLF
ncbi:MAG: hypothetical protein AAGA60_31855 [Cyanobacteria bacterium P01_E01_bin.42]